MARYPAVPPETSAMTSAIHFLRLRFMGPPVSSLTWAPGALLVAHDGRCLERDRPGHGRVVPLQKCNYRADETEFVRIGEVHRGRVAVLPGRTGVLVRDRSQVRIQVRPGQVVGYRVFDGGVA